MRPESISSGAILHSQLRWRAANWLTPLLLLCWVACTPAKADLVCQGEQEKALAKAQRIRQEWPLRGSNEEVSRYIQNLGERLTHAMGTGQLSAWRFNVVRDRSVNAFSIGNGHVYVTEGAVSFSHSEAEIAAILAHEIGHQMAGHFCQPMQNPSKGSFGGFFDWLFSGNHDDIKEQPIGSLTQVIDISKEKQADQYAVKLLKAAGYDPNAMLEVAKRLPEQNGITHLRDYRRIHALENMLKGTAPGASQESPAFRQIQDKLRIE